MKIYSFDISMITHCYLIINSLSYLRTFKRMEYPQLIFRYWTYRGKSFHEFIILADAGEQIYTDKRIFDVDSNSTTEKNSLDKTK